LSATNYTFAFATGHVSISKAQITVAAGNATRGYRQPDPVFSATYSGFVNGDTTNVVFGSPAFTTTATPTSLAGDYSVIPSLGTLSATNYTFTFANGVLKILWSPPGLHRWFHAQHRPWTSDSLVIQIQ